MADDRRVPEVYFKTEYRRAVWAHMEAMSELQHEVTKDMPMDAFSRWIEKVIARAKEIERENEADQ